MDDEKVNPLLQLGGLTNWDGFANAVIGLHQVINEFIDDYLKPRSVK
jgi:hypothetical protein